MDRITIQQLKQVYEKLPQVLYEETKDASVYYDDFSIELYKEQGDTKVYSGIGNLYFCNNDVITFIVSESCSCYNAKEYFNDLFKLPYMKKALEASLTKSN